MYFDAKYKNIEVEEKFLNFGSPQITQIKEKCLTQFEQKFQFDLSSFYLLKFRVLYGAKTIYLGFLSELGFMF